MSKLEVIPPLLLKGTAHNMGFSKQLIESQDEIDFMQGLIDEGYVEDERAKGILRQAIAQGTEGLTRKQRWVWEEFIQHNINEVEDCARCSAPIPWSEKLNALDNGGYCSYCEHVMNSDD